MNTQSGSVAKFKEQHTIDLKALIRGKTKEEEVAEMRAAEYGYNYKEEEEYTGDGELTVWRIENFQKVPVPVGKYGIFFGGDSYIILFQPAVNKVPVKVYYWLGRTSSSDEKGSLNY